jgi:tetratricopeptide (TPR) repeat protein
MEGGESLNSRPAVTKRRLKVFLCHSTDDKRIVRRLYRRLKADGFQVWLDEEDLGPGDDWKKAIEDEVRKTDAMVVCISRGSVNKEGFLNKEIKIALDEADLKPQGKILIIPTKMEEVEVPRQFREFHWANLRVSKGYERLVGSLNERAIALDLAEGVASKTKKELLKEWTRVHLAAVLVGFSVTAILLGVVSYKLYEIRRQYRLEAAHQNQEGLESLQLFDPEQAEFSFGKAATADPENAVYQANLALVLSERGKILDAKAAAKKALEGRKRLAEKDRLWVEGAENEVNWRLAAARDSYNVGWSQYKDKEAKLRLARIQVVSGQASTALDSLNELKASASGSPDARIDYLRAQAADAEQDYKAEVDMLTKILEEHPKEKDPLVAATALSQKCWALSHLATQPEEIVSAEGLCLEAKTIFEANGDRLGSARAQTRLANMLADSDDKQTKTSAKAFYESALDLSSAVESKIDQAGVHQNLANWYINQGDYESAQHEYEKALKNYVEIEYKQGEAELKNNWGTKLIDSCQYEQALAKFKDSQKDFGDTNSEIGKATATYNLSLMLFMTGDLEHTSSGLISALGTAKKIHLNTEEPKWRGTLAELYLAQDNPKLSEECFRGRDCGPGVELPEPAEETHEMSRAGQRGVALAQIESNRTQEARDTMRAQLREIKMQPEKDRDQEEEGQAIDVLVRALLAPGNKSALVEAKKYLADAPSLDIQDCRTKWSLAIDAARVSALEGEYEQALNNLHNVEEQANDKKVPGHEFEAVLAQAETNLRAGRLSDAEMKAGQVRDDHRAKVYSLIQKKADALLKKIAAQQKQIGS